MSFPSVFAVLLFVQLTLSRPTDHDSNLFTYSSICLNLQSLTISNIDWDTFFDLDSTAYATFSAFTNAGPESHRAFFFSIHDSPQLNSTQPMTVSFHNQFSSVGCWIQKTQTKPMINDIYLSLTIYQKQKIQLKSQTTVDLNGDTSFNIWHQLNMNTIKTSKYSTANVQTEIKIERKKDLNEMDKNQMSSLTKTVTVDDLYMNTDMIDDSNGGSKTYVPSKESLMMIAASVASFVGVLVLFFIIIWAYMQYTRKEYKTIPTYNDNPRSGILRKISLRSAVEKHWKKKKKKNIMKPCHMYNNTCATPLQNT